MANSKWGGTIASTIRTTTLALCYSVAEYAAPIWARSHHAHVLDSELNTVCRAIAGCLKPTNVEDLYLLAGIAPPDIRRDVCDRVVEKTKQEWNVAHSQYSQTPIESRLKSRSCFLSSVRPANFHPKIIRCNEWQRRLNTKPHSCSANLTESLARGHTNQGQHGDVSTAYVQALRAVRNSGRSGATMKEILHATVVSHQRTPDICLEWPLLAHSCSLDDLLQFNKTMSRTMEDSGLMTRWRRHGDTSIGEFMWRLLSTMVCYKCRSTLQYGRRDIILIL